MRKELTAQQSRRHHPDRLLRLVTLGIICALFAFSLVSAQPAFAAGESGDQAVALAGQSVFDDLVVASGETLRGDVIVYNGDATVESGGVIEGSLVVYSGDVEVESGGVIEGDLTAWSGDVTIAGNVDGNVSAVSGDVEIVSGASVGGDVSTVSGEIDREDGSSVEGNIVRGPQLGIPEIPAPLSILKGVQPPHPPAPPAVTTTLAESVLGFFGRMIGAGIVTLLLTALLGLVYMIRPAAIERAQTAMSEQLGPNFALGLGVNFGLIVVITLLNIVCCLLPLAAIPGLMLLFVNLVGLTVVARTLGMRLAPPTSQPTAYPVVHVALGGLILIGAMAFLWALAGFLRWPVGLAFLIITAPGVGAFVRPWLNRERWNKPPALPSGNSSPVTVIVPGADGVSQAQSVSTKSAPLAETPGSEPVKDAIAPAQEQRVEEIAVQIETIAVTQDLVESSVPTTDVLDQSADQAELIVSAPPPSDDFTRIVGIGRTWDQRLKMAGISTFAQLAAQTPESLAAVLGIAAEQVIEDNLLGQAAAVVGE
jgi:predicted flap endonuclease-1-like 5' DNA nuclease/cytoskeletal protein CcmA (bactofilin family)